MVRQKLDSEWCITFSFRTAHGGKTSSLPQGCLEKIPWKKRAGKYPRLQRKSTLWKCFTWSNQKKYSKNSFGSQLDTVQGAVPSMRPNEEGIGKEKKKSRIQDNRMSFENNKLSAKEAVWKQEVFSGNYNYHNRIKTHTEASEEWNSHCRKSNKQ